MGIRRRRLTQLALLVSVAALLVCIADDVWAVEKHSTCGALLCELETRLVVNGILVSWQTSAAADVRGFDLLRRSRGSPYHRMNLTFMEAQRSGDLGTAYSYLDLDVKPGTTYEYMLTITLTNGADVFQELPQATARWWIQLPLTVH